MYSKIYEWLATAILMYGVYLSAINDFPMNVYVSLIGNVMWFVLGVMWKKWSLIAVQVLITVIYSYGLYKYLVG
jgi:hypothetical protein